MEEKNWFSFCRLKVVFEYYKMGLDCFFAVWFVVGNVWIFGGHSSISDAPNLYRYLPVNILRAYMIVCRICLLYKKNSDPKDKT